MRYILAFILLIISVTSFAATPTYQIGIKDAKPFAYKENGVWKGYSVDLVKRQATEAQARADAAKRKAELLGPAKVEENDAVAAAMAAASGEPPVPTSVTDRLAALRK